MKKFLSVLLAVMMVLSTVSFAAPSLAGVADTAVEAPAFEAPAADLAADEENILLAFEFDSTDGGVNYAGSRGWKQTVEDGCLHLVPNGAEKLGDLYAAISVNFPAGTIKNIVARIKYTNYSSEGTQFFVRSDLGAGWAVNDSSYARPVVDGEWYDVDVRTLIGDTSFAKLTNGTMKSFRLDLTPTVSANTEIDIDYIRFIGYPQKTITLNMGTNTALSSQVVKITENTTAKGALDLIDMGDDISKIAPKALVTADGVRLADDALVAEYDELTVLWASFDTFGFDFDKAVADGKVTGYTGKFPLDASTAGIARFTTTPDTTKVDGTANAIRADRARIVLSGLDVPANSLNKIYVKLRYTARPENGFAMVCDENGGKGTYDASYTGFDFWWHTEGYASAYDGTSIGNPYTMPALNEWVVFEIDPSKVTGNKGDGTAAKDENGAFINSKLLDVDVTQLRFDMWAGSKPIPAGITIEIDDIVLVGALENEATVDLSGAGLANQKVTFTVNTTVEDFIKKIDTSASALAVKSIKVAGATLSLSTLVADYVNDGDTVEAVFAKDISILKGYEFTSSTEGVAIRQEYGVVHTAENGALKMTYANSKKLNDLHSGGSVPVNAKAGEISDIRWRLRITGSPQETVQLNYYSNDGTTTTYLGAKTFDVVDGEWMEVSVKDCIAASHWTTLTTNDLSYLRFGIHGPAGNIADEDTVIEIDYIRYYTNAKELNVDMGENDDVLDDVYGFNENTTVADLISKLDLSAYHGTLEIRSFVTADGVELALEDKLADYVEEGDTVTAVWDEMNILFGSEFDDASLPYNMTPSGSTWEIKNGKLVLTATGNTGTTYLNIGATSLGNGVYDFLDIPFSDIKAVEVRVAVSQELSEEYFGVVSTDEKYDQTFSKGVVNDGEFHVYSFEDFGKAPVGEILKSFRFLQYRNVPAGVTITYDYVRVIGYPAPPASAPANEGKELRNIADEYDNAIRFKASVDAATDAASETIGWLVSTEAYLDGAELDYAAYEAAASNKVKVAYQRQNGEAVVKNFFDDRDDDKKIFAAFIYNIPAKNALDNVVVRPFVVAEEEYFYGEAVTTNLFEMAVAPYLTFLVDGDDFASVKGYLAENYPDAAADELYEMAFTSFDNGGEELLAYNEAYAELSAEQQAYVVEIIKAVI